MAGIRTGHCVYCVQDGVGGIGDGRREPGEEVTASQVSPPAMANPWAASQSFPLNLGNLLQKVREAPATPLCPHSHQVPIPGRLPSGARRGHRQPPPYTDSSAPVLPSSDPAPVLTSPGSPHPLLLLLLLESSSRNLHFLPAAGSFHYRLRKNSLYSHSSPVFILFFSISLQVNFLQELSTLTVSTSSPCTLTAHRPLRYSLLPCACRMQ